jgi:hypothetical protein
VTPAGLDIQPGEFLAVFTAAEHAQAALADPVLAGLGLHVSAATGVWLLQCEVDWPSMTDPQGMPAIVGQVESHEGYVLVTGQRNS